MLSAHEEWVTDPNVEPARLLELLRTQNDQRVFVKEHDLSDPAWAALYQNPALSLLALEDPRLSLLIPIARQHYWTWKQEETEKALVTAVENPDYEASQRTADLLTQVHRVHLLGPWGAFFWQGRGHLPPDLGLRHGENLWDFISRLAQKEKVDAVEYEVILSLYHGANGHVGFSFYHAAQAAHYCGGPARQSRIDLWQRAQLSNDMPFALRLVQEEVAFLELLLSFVQKHETPSLQCLIEWGEKNPHG